MLVSVLAHLSFLCFWDILACSHMASVSGHPSDTGFSICLWFLLQQKATEGKRLSDPTTQHCGGVARRLPTVYSHPTNTLHSRVRNSLTGSSGKTHRGFDHPISETPSHSVNMLNPAGAQRQKPVSGRKLIKSISETKT